MALKELECLTCELESITQSLKNETRSQERIVLIERFSDILKIIKIRFGSHSEPSKVELTRFPSTKEAG